MRKLFLAISAAALFSIAGLVAAQTSTTLVQSSVDNPTATATEPDPGTKMRLAAMDTSEAAFRKLDTDNDGRISALEAAENPRVAAAFTMADKDKDGYLSKEEFEAMSSSATSSPSTSPAAQAIASPKH